MAENDENNSSSDNNVLKQLRDSIVDTLAEVVDAVTKFPILKPIQKILDVADYFISVKKDYDQWNAYTTEERANAVERWVAGAAAFAEAFGAGKIIEGLVLLLFPEIAAGVVAGIVLVGVAGAVYSVLIENPVSDLFVDILKHRVGVEFYPLGLNSDPIRSLTDNDDNFVGGAFVDKVDGLKGDDVIYGGHGNDILRGGEGSDQIIGSYDRDVIEGGQGR